MRASPRFLEGFFKNTAGVGPGLKPGTAFSTMGEFFLGGKERTLPGPLPFESLLATWLGRSTVLLEVDGLRVLTDAIWVWSSFVIESPKHNVWEGQEPLNSQR